MGELELDGGTIGIVSNGRGEIGEVVFFGSFELYGDNRTVHGCFCREFSHLRFFFIIIVF